MKLIITIVVLLFIKFSFSQEIFCVSEKAYFGINSYLLNNPDSINKYIEDQTKPIIVSINFNEYFQIDSINYIQYDTLGAFMEDGHNPVKLKIWGELDSLIYSYFEFCPMSIEEYNSSNIISEEFILIIDKKEIKKYNKERKNLNYKKWQVEQVLDIIPNSKFQLNIKSLIIKDYKLNDYVLKGQLDYYNSYPIKLDANHFIHFKIDKTSENGIPKYYLSFNLYETSNSKYNLIFTNSNKSIYEAKYNCYFSQTQNNSIHDIDFSITMNIDFSSN